MKRAPSAKVGDEYVSNGGEKVVVTKYVTSKKMTVQFDDGVEITTAQINLKRGAFAHPTKGKIKPGDIFKCTRGCAVSVVHYSNASDITVQWDDGLLTTVSASSLRSGSFIHPTRWKIPVGTKLPLNSGEVVEVIEYNGATNIVVEFVDGVRVTTARSNLNRGGVAHPTRGVRIGEKFTTHSGWTGEVVGYAGAHDVTVKWQDGSVQRTSTTYVKSGNIKPAFQPSVCGIGYPGYPMLKGDKDSSDKAYLHWVGMMKRCYDPKTRAMPKNLSYFDCTIDESWHNYSVFKSWAEAQVGYDAECNHIDKDILVKGNRVYSAETCVLLPSIINLAISKGSTKGKPSNLPIGVTQIDSGFVSRCTTDKGREYLGFFKTPSLAFSAYKECKECYIKKIAEDWRHVISEAAYVALLNYVVQEDD